MLALWAPKLVDLAEVRPGMHVLVVIDRPRDAAAGPSRVAGVPAGTPVQTAITVVLNYNGTIHSATRGALAQKCAVIDRMSRVETRSQGGSASATRRVSRTFCGNFTHLRDATRG
jgi:hypothetical protein